LSDDQSEPKAIESVNDCLEILDERVGYIKLDSFEGDASKQVGEALDYMKSRGRDKLVLDLRANGGGLMTVLTDIAEYFIDNGGAKKSLVAFAEGKSKNEYFYTNENNFKDFLTDVAIIGDENTASASECLIGAMVYYEACSISKVVVEKDALGNARTYGKGIMQTTYKFLTGGAFKLTTARILWPDKTTCIHKTGVTPAMGAIPAEKGQGLAVAISLFN
jgi:carboxyl-terminal processing protease